MKRFTGLSGYSVSPADLIRFIIIASLTFLCVIITTYSIARNLGTIYAHFFISRSFMQLIFIRDVASGSLAGVRLFMRYLLTSTCSPIPPG